MTDGTPPSRSNDGSRLPSWLPYLDTDPIFLVAVTVLFAAVLGTLVLGAGPILDDVALGVGGGTAVAVAVWVGFRIRDR